MKKSIILALLLFVNILAYAVPSGCYEGSSRTHRGRCAIQISHNVMNITNRSGEVIARWTIVSDKDGVLTLRSEYGAGATARWWKEDGKVYLTFNYETYTLMYD